MSESESLTLDPVQAESPLAGVVREDVRPAVGRTVLAAALAAALGAGAWAAMVALTNHSIGIAAVGLGFLAGRLVHRFTGGQRGAFQAVAAAVAVVVALGGRYYGYLRGHTWELFRSHLGTEFSAFYLLWVGLGIAAAWRIVGPASTRI